MLSSFCVLVFFVSCDKTPFEDFSVAFPACSQAVSGNKNAIVSNMKDAFFIFLDKTVLGVSFIPFWVHNSYKPLLLQLRYVESC